VNDSETASEERAQRSVTERIEREEFARGNIGPDEAPAEPRAASTIVLAREVHDSPFEVLLLKRPSTSRFAAGAFVFPGGTIDPGDAEPRLSNRLPVMGPDTEAAAVFAALRELFEETGLLLTNKRPGAAEEVRVRQELLENNLSFGAILEEHDLSFTSLEVCYFARWITPTQFSRRYDTHFFLTSLPVEHAEFEPTLTDEIDDFIWLTPGRAIELFRGGRLPMLFPTRVTLQGLAVFGSVDEMVTTYHSRRIEPLTPRLLIRGNSIRPVLPDDPEYEAADA
jgi:8-oxo-dGTP pyrophosphatase MutT (NUDIX family)